MSAQGCTAAGGGCVWLYLLATIYCTQKMCLDRTGMDRRCNDCLAIEFMVQTACQWWMERVSAPVEFEEWFVFISSCSFRPVHKTTHILRYSGSPSLSYSPSRSDIVCNCAVVFLYLSALHRFTQVTVAKMLGMQQAGGCYQHGMLRQLWAPPSELFWCRVSVSQAFGNSLFLRVSNLGKCRFGVHGPRSLQPAPSVRRNLIGSCVADTYSMALYGSVLQATKCCKLPCVVPILNKNDHHSGRWLTTSRMRRTHCQVCQTLFHC